MGREIINFNKEIIFGELGSVLGAPLFAFIFSRFVENPDFISGSAVAGGIIGMAIFWIYTRIMDKGEGYSLKKLADDIKYFTPAAFIIALLFYYPTVFFVSKSFLTNNHRVLYSVIVAQVAAFLFFLTGMNIYRYFLYKVIGKKL